MDYNRYTTLPDPTAFAGLNQLNRFYPVPAKWLREQLTAVDSYTRHREAKKPLYNPTFVREPRRLLQADLLDKSRLKSRNANIPYWLVVIDSFTRFAWIRPLKNKFATTTADAFETILDEMSDSEKVKLLLTDRGKEFVGGPFQTVLRNRNIEHIFPQFHAPHVERFNRTIQSIVGKYLTEYATARFVDIMHLAVQSYNTRVHRMIGMTPAEAELRENQDKVRLALETYYRTKIYKNVDDKKSNMARKKKSKFAVGDLVRKVAKRSKFFRSFHPTFASELYKISQIYAHLPTTLYGLEDLEGNRLSGRYYPRELQKVSDLLSSFKVDKIHEWRTNPITGEEEAKVSFEGLPSRYKRFVPVASLVP